MEGNLKIKQKSLNLTSFGIKEVKETEKAADGVYVDSPLNRKLGRVGMPYKKGDGEKEGEGGEGKKEKTTKVDKVLSKSKVLGEAKGDRLNAIIKYAELDIPKDATDEVKRQKIAESYIKSAELKGKSGEIANALDEIVEDALADYVPPKNNSISEGDTVYLDGKTEVKVSRIEGDRYYIKEGNKPEIWVKKEDLKNTKEKGAKNPFNS